jgi:hypothetical protein
MNKKSANKLIGEVNSATKIEMIIVAYRRAESRGVVRRGSKEGRNTDIE